MQNPSESLSAARYGPHRRPLDWVLAHWRLGLLLGHLAIALPLAIILNVWVDEAYSLNTVQDGLWLAVQRAITVEQQPPLYFALLALWQQGHGSIVGARLLSVLCSGIAVWLAPAISRRYAPRLHPAWMQAAVALHPYLIWAAVEIRPYALGIALTALMLVVFYDGFLHPDGARPRARVAYGIVAVAAAYVNYLLVLGLVANAVALLVVQRRAFWPHARVLTLAAIAWVPLALPAFLQLSASSDSLAHLSSSLLDSAKHTLGRTLIHTVSTCPGHWQGWQRGLCYRLVALVVPAMVALVGWRLWRGRCRPALAQGVLWGSTAVTLLLLLLLLYATDRASRAESYTFILFVPVIASLLAAFSDLRQGDRRRLLGWWMGAVVLPAYLLTLAVSYSPLAKMGDWQRVAHTIQAQEGPNQPILVFYAEAALPFNHHYRGINTVVPIPQAVGVEGYNFQDGALRDVAQVEAALAGLAGRFDTAWLITMPNEHLDDPSLGECPVLGLAMNCGILEDYVRSHYTVSDRQDFYHATLRRLQPLPTPAELVR
ncbi:hypothetical protein PGN35_022015 [Nodosilinea sp. PGN35]|uniref:hypothetical protein n=1 Tax=Nodosilinea sp. PGN35 TaxID=3020489 RepID=UPI0023B285D2|nr:hypothetical protein [Nodosilinea sp. TSF1-S3]MDF0367036.1 hypothetical protein [Nodosilinea sp. TSF1-S3]